MLNEQQLNTSIKNFLERKSREYSGTRRYSAKKRMVIQLDNSSLDISREDVIRGEGASGLISTASQMLRATPGKLDKA